MIFYTLKGPNHTLEFHDDKLKLIKRTWWMIFSHKNRVVEYKLSDLSEFKITTPRSLTGKLEWATFEGAKGYFRFTTNMTMMTMIEKYVHTLIVKNNIRRSPVVLPFAQVKKKKSKKKHRNVDSIAA